MPREYEKSPPGRSGSAIEDMMIGTNWMVGQGINAVKKRVGPSTFPKPWQARQDTVQDFANESGTRMRGMPELYQEPSYPGAGSASDQADALENRIAKAIQRELMLAGIE